MYDADVGPIHIITKLCKDIKHQNPFDENFMLMLTTYDHTSPKF